MISVNGVSKYYGSFRAVNNISFDVRDGEITGLLGPNGAGKTTTLRMLTCFFKPNSGTITVGGHQVDVNPFEIKKMIGYLPESAPIYGDMLVYDYLKFVLEIRGIEDLKRIGEMGELCGIREVMHKNINELSKGYKQRVGLAHAMIHDPDILILDEPTSGLDPNQIIEIRNVIKEIGKRKTVILSTHILPEVEATCDRVIIINEGNIVANDETGRLRESFREGRKIYVKVGGTGFDAIAGEMKTLPGVIEVNETGEKEEAAGDYLSLVIHVEGANDIRPDVSRLIHGNNWNLYEMTDEQVSLENIFRELTIGGDNE
ncbi:MAG: ATP-binding cassette domain-containing protein [bacterium]|nr:ATP-binding cassette domain-containing protein [bacterium]